MKTGLCPGFDVGFINEKNEWQEHNPEVCTRGLPILGRQIHQGRQESWSVSCQLRSLSFPGLTDAIYY